MPPYGFLHCQFTFYLKTRQLCRNGWIAEALQMGSESGVSKLAKRVTNGEFDAATGLLELLNSRNDPLLLYALLLYVRLFHSLLSTGLYRRFRPDPFAISL